MNFDLDKPFCMLDLDGVLNSANYFQHRSDQDDVGRPDNQIDPAAVKYLNEIADWNFVLSSTWRKFHSIDEMNKMLQSRGFKGTIIDKTPVLETPGSLRGNEIYEWIRKNIPDSWDFKNYVIFDDDSDMLYWQQNNFIHIDGHFGLSPNHVYKAKRMLGIS